MIGARNPFNYNAQTRGALLRRGLVTFTAQGCIVPTRLGTDIAEQKP